MNIEHVAIWVNDLEKMRVFYELYFGGKSNEKYYNKVKQFESYFITFSSGARLEIMRKKGIDETIDRNLIGWAHIAFSTGSRESVDQLTGILQNDGFPVLSGPRTTGDGYYESLIQDPEGNEVEITV